MFTLAHISDPHLAPLPAPRWSELMGKRITGYINWQRKRRFIHDPAALAAIVAALKVGQLGQIFSSPVRKIDIISGTKLWEREFRGSIRGTAL